MAFGAHKHTANTPKLDRIVRKLNGLIRRLKLQAGGRLPPERELAEQLGFSRGDIRKGTGYLAALGVLEVRHGSGAYLSDAKGSHQGSIPTWEALSGADTRHLFEARMALESELAALAAERCTPRHLKSLADEIDGMALSIDDASQFLIHDVRFHRGIGAASGNPVLAGLMESIAGTVYEERQRAAGGTENRSEALTMHRKIYRLLCGHDAEGARKAMLQHLRSAMAGAGRMRRSRVRVVSRLGRDHST